MMLIENKYNLKEKVFLITDSDQLERFVTAIQVSPDNLSYRLTQSITETWHYDFEISRERDLALNSDNQKEL